MQATYGVSCSGPRVLARCTRAEARPVVLRTSTIKGFARRDTLRYLTCRAELEEATESRGAELENPESEAARKKDEADKLRAAEKFMKVGTGEAFCKGCGYEYKPAKGDPEYPVAAGTLFGNLPEDWQCPICGAEKRTFESRARTIAGFEENQGYGFGTNSMTSGQKSLLIYGSLAVFFALFCAGYLLQ